MQELTPSVSDLLQRLVNGERKALSKAITLVESTHEKQKTLARSLVTHLPTPPSTTLRLAISGAPGVGKSTFLEALGLHLIALGHKPAILTIDPSSHISGGSILGDRTRMEELSKNPDAFIRQSPSAQFLGGVSRRTRESMFVCESAGFDIILVETVGVGQSEFVAADMCDLFVLLIQPGSGDDLQGVKKGVMEMADFLVVTKSDGDLSSAARTSKRHLKNAIHILQNKQHGQARRVISISALERKGVDQLWLELADLSEILRSSGFLNENRVRQNEIWLKDVIQEMWLEKIDNPSFETDFQTACRDVHNGQKHVYDAAFQVIEKQIRNL